MGTVNDKKAAFLWDELTEYEKRTKMTAEERNALHEWVLDGNSVHENSSMAYTDSGIPCDFLEVYRYEEGIRKELETLSPREKENYLARLHGGDTFDTLKEDFHELFFKAEIYERVLRSHGLLDEAMLRIKQAKEKSQEETRKFTEWMKAHPEEELPFKPGRY